MTDLRLCCAAALLGLLLGCGGGSAQELVLGSPGVPKPVAIPLIHADAHSAAVRLKALLGPNLGVTANKESNTIYLRTDAIGVERARMILARLDAPKYYYVVRVRNADPVPVAGVTGAAVAVLAFLCGEPEAMLVPLKKEGAIYFIATEAQAEFVRWLVQLLDR